MADDAVPSLTGVDEDAASPLVVLASFVVVAIIVTAVAYAVWFDTPEASVSLQYDPAGPAFEVTEAHGGLWWEDVEIRLIDAAGEDLAPTLLEPVEGPIEPGEDSRIPFRHAPPAGRYLLLVEEGGNAVGRLAFTA